MAPEKSSSSSRFITTIERKYGRNALPNMFDAKARDPSSRLYAYVMKTPNPADGFDELTYAIVANAINRLSWWLMNEVGLAEGEVFAYMGPPDLRYFLFCMAAAKTGTKIMLPSLRNTISAQQMLFERVNARIIIYGSELRKNLQALFNALGLETREAPGYKEAVDETVVPHYKARELTDEMLNEPIFLLHTSGSSGNPKPIGQSAEYWLRNCSFVDVPKEDDVPYLVHINAGHNFLQFFPSFHMAGLNFYVQAAFIGSTLVMNHPAASITAEHIINILNTGIATSLGAADSILTDLSRTKEGLEAMSKLDLVVYGGGPLSPQTGATIAPHVKNVSSALGMTENGLVHSYPIRGSSHWDCVKFNKNVGYRFDEVSPGIFELVVSLSPKYRMFHPASLIFPDKDEWATKDLYTRVPEIENCYRYQGRRDDLIVLSNGEKVNPLPLEAIVATHPAVRSALFVGEHRFLPSLLIELREGYAVNSEEESREMVEKLWETISKANLEAPRFSRVPKALVYILTPTESFNRSGKMTVQRQSTVQKFNAQIDALYAAAGEGLLSEGLELTDSSSAKSIKQLAKKLYLQLLDLDDESSIDDDDDVLELGMDSLQVAVGVQKLKAVLKVQEVKVNLDKINPHFFYTSPSVRRLARSIDHLINGGAINGTNGHTNGVNGSSNGIDKGSDRCGSIQQMIDKYSTGLDEKLPPKKMRPDHLTVVLTGSTGSLGSYLLNSLVKSTRVTKVICFNRSTDAEKRQTAGNKQKDLLTPWESQGEGSKSVEFLTTDLSKPDFGVGEATYNQLLTTVDAIIHCAWKVDFNHTIESFEKRHIAGTRHLIDLSRKCEYQAPILFISSISTALNWIQKNPGKAVPESSIHDLDSPEFLGYGESKYVAERLIEAHSSSSGFISSVMRVGQIAGPVLSTAGVWNVQEWFPSLLASSKHLAMLPDSLGTMNGISWVPVDVLARIIVQLLDATSDQSGSSDDSLAVYNLVNPKVVSWSLLLDTALDGLGGPDKIQVVSLTEWVKALERSAQENYGFVVESNPAIKLLEFWHSIAKNSKENNCNTSKMNGHMNGDKGHDTPQEEFAVTKLQSDSSEASGMEAVSPEWMKIWLKQWGF